MNYKRIDRSGNVKIFGKKDFHKIMVKKFGKRFLQYRQRWDASGELELTPTFPLQLDINLDFKCNLKCVFCPMCLDNNDSLKKAYLDTNAVMPLKVYKRLIDEGKKYDLPSVNLGNFNEPLINKNLIESIIYAKKNNVMDVMFSTNGLLMNEDKAIQILNAEPSRVMFSIDAVTKEIYNKLRINSDFDKVIANVNRFLELKQERGSDLPIVRTSFIIMKDNYKELTEFKEYWKNKVDFICEQDYTNCFVGSKHFDYGEEFAPPASVSARQRGELDFKCTHAFQRIAITPAGKCLPCCSTVGFLHNVGDIHKQSLKEIWDSKKMQDIRTKVNTSWENKNQVCKLCFFSLKNKVPVEELDYLKYKKNEKSEKS